LAALPSIFAGSEMIGIITDADQAVVAAQTAQSFVFKIGN
jgi:hypothetical protein